MSINCSVKHLKFSGLTANIPPFRLCLSIKHFTASTSYYLIAILRHSHPNDNLLSSTGATIKSVTPIPQKKRHTKLKQELKSKPSRHLPQKNICSNKNKKQIELKTHRKQSASLMRFVVITLKQTHLPPYKSS